MSIGSWKQRSVLELKTELETAHSYLCNALDGDNKDYLNRIYVETAAEILAKLLEFTDEKS